MAEDNFTSTQNTTSERSSYAILAPPLFSMIIIIGLIGNTLLIYTVIRWREMRTPCNYLIVNNAAADLGVVIIAAPLRIVEVYHGWVLGEPTCRIVAPTQDVFVVVSVITYTLIAWERYRAVITPFKPKLTLRSIVIAAILIWVLAYLSTGLPIALHLSVIKIGEKSWCIASFASDISRQMYELYLVVVYLVLPLAFQTLAYSRLVHRLTRKDPMERSLSDSKSSRTRRVKKRRLVRATIILVTFFQICYIPRMVIMLLYEFARDFTNNTYFKYVDLVLMALFYVKHVINPIVLFIIGSDFRKRFPCGVHKIGRIFPLKSFSSRRSTQNSKLLNINGKNGKEREIILKESALWE